MANRIEVKLSNRADKALKFAAHALPVALADLKAAGFTRVAAQGNIIRVNDQFVFDLVWRT